MGKTLKNSKITRDTFTESVWQEIADRPLTDTITPTDVIYDVLVVGAGITGITAALLLQEAGKKVIVAEGNTLLFGTTSGTTAHLNTFFDATYPQIESDFGEDAAKLIAEAGKEALDKISSLIDNYEIDCDFEHKNGYLYSQNEKETKELRKIFESSKKVAVDVAETGQNGVPIQSEYILKFGGQAQFHPVRYVAGLAKAFMKAGGRLMENAFIRSTELGEDQIHTAKADQFQIRAKHIVYATHLPPGINLLSFRCAPYRSYVLGVKLADEAYPDCLAYDMKEPYHYIRTHEVNGEKLLIVGGEDHKTGHDDPSTAFGNLEEYVRQHFNVESVPYRWSAQYYTSADGLPYIGQLPAGEDRIYISTGYNGNGMQFGTLGGMVISDLILGRNNKYAELLSPSRIKPIAGFTEFVKENADVAYHFVADRFSAEEIESLQEIKPGEGKLVDFNDQKLAIYKSTEGIITALNPVCTHAKCIVNFNNEEKSWDCPCHGGRFDVHGNVLTGPPRHNLQQIDLGK